MDINSCGPVLLKLLIVKLKVKSSQVRPPEIIKKEYFLDVRHQSARNALTTLKTQTGVLDIISTCSAQACHRDDAANRHYSELEFP